MLAHSVIGEPMVNVKNATQNRSAPKNARESRVFNGQFHGQASTHYRAILGTAMTTREVANTSKRPAIHDINSGIFARLNRKERRALKSKRGIG
jgi:hypothetical protein